VNEIPIQQSSPPHHSSATWISLDNNRTRWVTAAAVIAALATLYLFAPASYPFYPRCAFYMLTGLQCPGCGGLRAAHAILHGDFSAAFHYNELLTLLSPVALCLGSFAAIRKWQRKPVPHWLANPAWLWIFLSMALAFAIARNLLR
jgi:hypothetical protein